MSLPLQSVLDALPPGLRGRVIPTDLGGATLSVALPKILAQLPLGAVKLSFGELRQAAPQLFSPGEQSDDQDFELPLNELLVRLNPALLPKPPTPQVASGVDQMDDVFIPMGTSPLAGETPQQTAPPRTTPAKPADGPIRVPLARDLAEVPSVGSPASEQPSPTSSGNNCFCVPLASLTASWPALVRAEIAQLDCAQAQVALPEPLVQAGMKRGKVAFPWKILRCWIHPSPPIVISNHDDTKLELPLDVLMPLFLARWQKTPSTKPRLVVDESIPALFAPAMPLESESTLTGNESNTGDDGAAVAKSPNPYTSPTEIIARATALAGVTGALVILPEGLLVASSPSTPRPDALAAFLARAFGRVAQGAQDVQVGELSRMEFWAESGPWLIFNLNTVLFATFGPTGGSLPIAELAALAKELDPKRES